MTLPRTSTNPTPTDNNNQTPQKFKNVTELFNDATLSIETLLQQCEKIIGTPKDFLDKQWQQLIPQLTRRCRKKIQDIFSLDLSPEKKVAALQAFVNVESITNKEINFIVRTALEEACSQATTNVFTQVLYNKALPQKEKITQLIKLNDELIEILVSYLKTEKSKLRHPLLYDLWMLFVKYTQNICIKKWNHLLHRQDLSFDRKIDKMKTIKQQGDLDLQSFNRETWVESSVDGLPAKINQLFALEPSPSSDRFIETSRKFYAIRSFLRHLLNLFLSTQFDVVIQGKIVKVTHIELNSDLLSPEAKKADEAESIQEKLALEKQAAIFHAWLTKGSGSPYQQEIENFIKVFVAFVRTNDETVVTELQNEYLRLGDICSLLISHPTLKSFFYQAFTQYPCLEAASVAFSTGDVIAAHLQLKEILLPNFKGCDLFLMLPPKDGHYKPSDQRHLFLYKDKDGPFYYFPDNQTKQDLSLPQKRSRLKPPILSDEQFNQPEEKPLPCNHQDTCQSVLRITSAKGHTNPDDSYEEFYAIEEWLNAEGKIYQETIKQFGQDIKEKLSAEQMQQYQQALLGVSKKPGLLRGFALTEFSQLELFAIFLTQHTDILDFFVQALCNPLITQAGIAYAATFKKMPTPFKGGIHIIADSVMSMYPLDQRQAGEVFFWEEIDENDKTVWKAAMVEIDGGQKKLSQAIVPLDSDFFQTLTKGSAEEERVQAANDGATVAPSSIASDSFQVNPYFKLINRLRFLLQSEEKDFLFGKRCLLFLLPNHPIPGLTIRTARDAAFFSAKPSKQKTIDQANGFLESKKNHR